MNHKVLDELTLALLPPEVVVVDVRVDEVVVNVPPPPPPSKGGGVSVDSGMKRS